jgi:hypothetical protein
MTITTVELADLLYPPELERRDLTPERAKARRRSRLTNAAKQARRWGIAPVDGRSPLLWPEAAVRAKIAAAPGKGNRGVSLVRVNPLRNA